MKKIAIVVLALTQLVCRAGDDVKKSVEMKLSGFVKNDLMFDSRQNASAVEGLLTLYPLKPLNESSTGDPNSEASIRALSISTRLSLAITGPQFLGAQTSARVEADFTGGQVTNSLRFRHAYTALSWEKSSLLFGRTWHPLFIERVFPSVLALNTGAPFQVFNRSPQLRFTTQVFTHTSLIAAMVYQSRYSNYGPDDKLPDYQRNALWPNLHAQLQYSSENWVWGVAADWKALRPQNYSTDAAEQLYRNKNLVTSSALLGYVRYAKGLFEVKAKSMWGQNMSEHILMGGYAVKSIDPVTGNLDYTVSNNSYTFINILYGSTLKWGMFAGYMKNLGMNDDIVGDVYARGADIDYCYRLSTMLIYRKNNFQAGFEPEYTVAAYGTIDNQDKGRVKDASETGNLRLLFSCCYYF